MLLEEYDRLLAEAEAERRKDIAALEHAVMLLESSIVHPLSEMEKAEADEIILANQGLIGKALNNLHFYGSKKDWDDAKMFANTYLTKAVYKLRPGASENEISTYLYTTVENCLKNFMHDSNLKGFTIGRDAKGKKDKVKAKDVKVGARISGDAQVKNKDGSDSGETVFSTMDSGEDTPDVASDKNMLRARIQKLLKDKPDGMPKKLLSMIYSGDYYNDSAIGYSQTKCAKDWYKWDLTHGSPEYRQMKREAYQKAAENAGMTFDEFINKGVTEQTFHVNRDRALPVVQGWLKDLRESKIDALDLYVKEELAMMEGRTIPVVNGKIEHERANGMTVEEFLEDFWNGEASWIKEKIDDMMQDGMPYDEAFKKALNSSNPIVLGLQVKDLPAKCINDIKRKMRSWKDE